MERVVYLLGAGFSAPLGLPVMNDFIVKSKDQFARDPERFAHFRNVLSTIDHMHKTLSYYRTDLFNIEEVLSVLDMQDMVSGLDRSGEFRKYVKEVIEYHTPEMPQPGCLGIDPPHPPRVPPERLDSLFGDYDEPMVGYGMFVANLVNLRVEPLSRASTKDEGNAAHGVKYSKMDHPEVKYDVVTLNYDRVIEKCCEHLPRYFVKDPNSEEPSPDIAKLHGCVSTDIVPPTWRKWTLRDRDLMPSWERAFNMLREANQIRIIGYSLPTTDANVRYLLQAAVIESANLKRIDVICLDRDQSMEQHYRSFITFKYLRFRNLDTKQYLSPPASQGKPHPAGSFFSRRPGNSYVFSDGLERRHDYFMASGTDRT